MFLKAPRYSPPPKKTCTTKNFHDFSYLFTSSFLIYRHFGAIFSLQGVYYTALIPSDIPVRAMAPTCVFPGMLFLLDSFVGGRYMPLSYALRFLMGLAVLKTETVGKLCLQLKHCFLAVHPKAYASQPMVMKDDVLLQIGMLKIWVAFTQAS